MRTVFYFFGLAFCSNLLAEPASQLGQNTVEPLSTANLTQWTIGLIVVLMLVLALAWLFKRSALMGSFQSSQMRVLSGISLGGREKAVLLKVGHKHLLVGVAPGHVSTLHCFEEGELPEEVNKTPESFQDGLARLMKRQEKGNT